MERKTISSSAEATIAEYEYREALENFRKAKMNFDNADPEYFEIANSELTAASKRLNIFYIRAKNVIGVIQN